ncbi:P44/Msp2 family outer membrane protein [Anaplasma capra]|uniref:P44/Msp2 family outer membrane protein n=1 Tax=Anaplasma capra TaxID=1562740 RepID=UPI0021D5E37A|nr:P44/Msp2 family outer membrane protein [Anaplasma capra]MCU7611261.1 P44/Msp2 family outer membrane protein [Anaplasma capra]MCU7612688.1 P44/Msp2 family outer membrane protein [Anaplasma capra]
MKPVVYVAAVLSTLSCFVPINSHGSHGRRDFYFSLGYGPTIGTVSRFRLDVSGETKAVLPYIGRVGSAELSSANYDWRGKKSEEGAVALRFENSSLFGLKGGVGCVVRGMRLDIEFGQERYKLQRQKYALLSGGGTSFALVKKAAAGALYDTEQLVEFLRGGAPNGALKHVSTRLEDIQKHDLVRGDRVLAASAKKKLDALLGALKKQSEDAAAALPAAAPATAQPAATVATLSEGEKVIIGRAIATGAEGMEIVEVHSVRATSAVMNACYDFPQIELIGWGAYPYTCAGIGVNFVGLTDRQFQPKFTYRLRAGLNYSIAPDLTAFIGGTFSKIVGADTDTPVHRAADDSSPIGRTRQKVTASFGLQYIGVELGARIGF